MLIPVASTDVLMLCSHYLSQELPATPKNFLDGAKPHPQAYSGTFSTVFLWSPNTHGSLQKFLTHFRWKSEGFDEELVGFWEIPFQFWFVPALD